LKNHCGPARPSQERDPMMSKRIRNSHPSAMERARSLRASMGKTERLLWRRLRGNAAGFRFRRQYSVEAYVLDFFCYQAMLCVEVDGEHHAARSQDDRNRDAVLHARGIETMRFRTVDVIENLDGVMEVIYSKCCERAKRIPFR